MRRLFFVVAFILFGIAAPAQILNPGGGSPGLATLGPSFNVAVNYGCKPDGSTDNSTCITNAFSASNAVTLGVPTIYFLCVPGTGCQYNINAGSGLSPFNPVIPTAIKCDPEVTLNFTSGSTAHAMDIGPTTTNLGLAGTVNAVSMGLFGLTAYNPSSNYINQGIVVQTSTNSTGGTGTMTVTVLYTIVSVS